MTDPTQNNDEFDQEASDRTLLRRFQAGENDAATSLYIRYAKRLRGLATKQTSPDLAVRVGSEEVVQSVFRTFFRRASVGHYDAAEGEDLWKLFLVIALNKIRSLGEYHRAKKRDVSQTTMVGSDFFQHLKGSNQESEEFAILKMTVNELLESLPAGHPEIVRLRIENHSIPEIAKATGRAQRTVERVLQSFRNDLLKMIES